MSTVVNGLAVGQYWYRVVTETTDGSGNPRVLYGSPVPFTIVGRSISVSTEPATAVDTPPKSATLSGYVLLSPGQAVTYVYEYGRDPGLLGYTTIVAAPPLTITGTGQGQFTAPQVVSNLATGNYWYRVVVSALDPSGNPYQLYGNIVPFTITGQPAMAATRSVVRLDSKWP